MHHREAAKKSGEEKPKWNYVVGFALIVGAVFFILKKW
ncbi:MAG: LPXTG cell wall anchor domain-containing protein [Candidatus Binatia bacterium]